jgi:hypothetical protein
LVAQHTKRLTFDMSGDQQMAKPAVGCPLDGRVRRRHHSRKLNYRSPAFQQAGD